MIVGRDWKPVLSNYQMLDKEESYENSPIRSDKVHPSILGVEEIESALFSDYQNDTYFPFKLNDPQNSHRDRTKVNHWENK